MKSIYFDVLQYMHINCTNMNNAIIMANVLFVHLP